MTAEGKREYSFDLVVKGKSVAQFVGSYSHLRNRCVPIFGDFPPKHIFENYTTNESNVAQRAEELRQFFELRLNTQGRGKLDTMGSRQMQVSSSSSRSRSSGRSASPSGIRPRSEADGKTELSRTSTSDRLIQASPRAARKAVKAAEAASTEANAWLDRVKRALGIALKQGKETK
jgi:hypothetical protein